MTRLPLSGYGFAAAGSEDIIIYAKQEKGDYIGYVYNTNDQSSTELGFSFLPKKCIAVLGNVVCALSISDYNQEFPDKWYMGSYIAKDSLWHIEAGTNRGTSLADPEDETGRTLDIINMQHSISTNSLYFINKTDQTAWMLREAIPERENIVITDEPDTDQTEINVDEN